MPNIATNTNYTLELYQKRKDNSVISIKANIPETFSFDIQNEWENRVSADLSTWLGSSAAGQIAGQIASAVAGGFGISTILQAATYQTWGGTSPMQFQFQFAFMTKNSAKDDVLTPVQDLVRMSAPDVTLGVFTSPGPTPVRRDLNRVLLRLGRFLTIPSVLITNVVPTFHTMLDPNGIPMAAIVDVTLRTANTPSATDILKYFSTANSYTDAATAYAATPQGQGFLGIGQGPETTPLPEGAANPGDVPAAAGG